MGRTLGALVAERDAARFVGRRDELELLEAAARRRRGAQRRPRPRPGRHRQERAAARVRAARERARARGALGRRTRARAGPGRARGGRRARRATPTAPLLVLDTYERMAALDWFLRRELLPRLPERAIVVTAGRRPPAPALVRARLGGRVARAAAAARSSRPTPTSCWPGSASPIRGSPRRLTQLGRRLAARAVDRRRRPGAEPVPGRGPAGRSRRSRGGCSTPSPTAGASTCSRSPRSRAPSRRGCWRAVLPEHEPAESWRWLRERSFAEPVGAGLALHELVRRTLRAELRDRLPEREAELRRRVVDHLHARARRRAS